MIGQFYQAADVWRLLDKPGRSPRAAKVTKSNNVYLINEGDPNETDYWR